MEKLYWHGLQTRASRDYSVNFQELLASNATSETPGSNSGFLNTVENDARGGTSATHEYGHFLEYLNKIANNNGNLDNEYHALDSEPNDIMWRNSGRKANAPLSNRVVTPGFYDRMNKGRGLGGYWAPGNASDVQNIGNAPDNQLYKDGKPVKTP